MNIENGLGTIKINNTLYAKVIYQAVSLTDNEMFMSAATPKILATKDRKGSTTFLSQNIEVTETDDEIDIVFYVIAKFGTSISKNAGLILQNVIEDLSHAFPNHSIHVKMKVIGVKSKNIARRDLEFVTSYEPER